MASPFVELEIGERTVKVTNPDKVLFPDAAIRSATSSTTTSRSATGSCARSASGRPSCGVSRTGSPASRSTRSASPRSARTGLRPRGSPSHPAVTRTSFASRRPRRSSGPRTSRCRLPSVAVPAGRRRPSRRAADRRRPAARHDFADGKRVAAIVRETLDEMGYVGWPRTSGNRGIHIAVRIEPNWEFPVVRRCALAFAREIERRAPELVTTAWWKEERGEKSSSTTTRTLATAPSPPRTPSARARTRRSRRR